MIFRSFIWSYLVFLLMFLTACRQAENATETNKPFLKPPTLTVDKQTAHNHERYIHLTGMVGDLPITAELFTTTDDDGKLLAINGIYRYDEYGGPIGLYGEINDDDLLTIMEDGEWNGTPHRFVGTWDEKKGFTGQWIKGDGKTKLPVTLVPSQDGILPLEMQQTAATQAAFSNLENSPKAQFRLSWPTLPDATPAQQRLLEQYIYPMLVDSTLLQKGAMTDAVKQQRQWYFEDYLAEVASLVKEGIIDTAHLEEAYSLNYEESTHCVVYYNSPTLLTLGVVVYSYSGGAHGMYGTSVASYDLAAMQPIKLSDVLEAGYESAVSTILGAAVRTKYQIGADASLTEILFEDHIKPNENFGLTDKGIFFVYQPYEIAPYAAGEITLFVAFEKIKDFVKAEWLQKTASTEQ